WSIGTPANSSYTNDEGVEQDARVGDNGDAGDDAGQQSEDTSDQVSGLMGGFESDGSGNANTSQNRVNSSLGSARGRIDSDAPNSADLAASASPDTGTVASIAAGANV